MGVVVLWHQTGPHLWLSVLVMFTVIDTVALNPQIYTVSAVGSLLTCCMCCTTLRMTDEQGCLLTYCMDGFSIRHETKGVLENATRMEERQGDTHDALQLFLYPSKPGSSWVIHLIIHFVFPKREDRHQMSTKKYIFLMKWLFNWLTWNPGVLLFFFILNSFHNGPCAFPGNYM